MEVLALRASVKTFFLVVLRRDLWGLQTFRRFDFRCTCVHFVLRGEVSTQQGNNRVRARQSMRLREHTHIDNSEIMSLLLMVCEA